MLDVYCLIIPIYLYTHKFDTICCKSAESISDAAITRHNTLTLYLSQITCRNFANMFSIQEILLLQELCPQCFPQTYAWTSLIEWYMPYCCLLTLRWNALTLYCISIWRYSVAIWSMRMNTFFSIWVILIYAKRTIFELLLQKAHIFMN